MAPRVNEGPRSSWPRASRLRRFALPALVFAAGCGPSGPARLELSDQAIVFSGVDPSAGPLARVVEVRNLGAEPATVLEVRLENEDETCGRFSLRERPPYGPVQGGGAMSLTVSFEPDSAAEPGCGCHSAGTLSLGFEVDPFYASLPAVATGECDRALLCTPSPVEFDGAVTETRYERAIACRNANVAPVEVGSVALDEDGAAAFELAEVSPSAPTTLGLAESLSIRVGFLPLEEGPHASSVAVGGPGGAELARIPLSGEASRERPSCASDPPVDPEPALEQDGYAIVLETPVPSSYLGTVRAFWFYDEQPPLIADVLVTSGGYADPACEVGQQGHAAYWRGDACLAGAADDLFVNIHALPFSDTVAEWVQSLELWDVVTVHGYEVERIDYDDGSYWTDAGCHTLIITWICDAP